MPDRLTSCAWSPGIHQPTAMLEHLPDIVQRLALGAASVPLGRFPWLSGPPARVANDSASNLAAL